MGSQIKKEGSGGRVVYCIFARCLANDLFDYHEKKQVAAFFMQRGYLYEVWQEKRGKSYLLAKVIDRGAHHATHHDDASFDYYILREKSIEPFSEHKKRRPIFPRPIMGPVFEMIFIYCSFFLQFRSLS